MTLPASLALLALALVSIVDPARAQTACSNDNGSCTDSRWHLLTITYGGTVTLLKGLTKHECEFAMHRARREPATDEEIANAKRASEARSRSYNECLDKNNIIFKEPPSENDTKAWEEFWKASMKAQSLCPSMQGYSVTIGPGDIRSAECFE